MFTSAIKKVSEYDGKLVKSTRGNWKRECGENMKTFCFGARCKIVLFTFSAVIPSYMYG